MRVVGSIEHPYLKITLFKMDNKLSVKFETGLFEQIYKFRTGDQIESVADVERLVDETFIAQVEVQFAAMQRIKNEALLKAHPTELEEFDEII